jgi:hypothetical protein
MILLVFFLALVQNFIATTEVYTISQVRPLKAGMYAGLNSLAAFLITVLIVVDEKRWTLLPAYVLGDALATFIALQKVKHGRDNNREHDTSS